MAVTQTFAHHYVASGNGAHTESWLFGS